MNTKITLPVMVAASALTIIAIAPLFAAEPAPIVTKADSDQAAYPGVVVTSTHPALAANLQGLLKPDQGLTVEEVAENSPADKAGLKSMMC